MDSFILPSVPIVGIHMQDWQDPHHFPIWYLKATTWDYAHIPQFEPIPGLLVFLVTGWGKIELGSHNLLTITSHHHLRANLQKNWPFFQAQYGNLLGANSPTPPEQVQHGDIINI
jgi:hypothetical protein